ncbi:MAG: Holliday junction resolvase RuvX [Gammaproteobacteria bacterium]
MSASAHDETLLAFDFGRRRIGVAVGNRRFGTASALDTLICAPSGPDYAAIGALIKEWQAARLVVGAPLGLDGKANDMSRAADKFSRKLAHEFNLPIERIDERHTSVEAEDMIRSARRGGRKRRARSTDVDKLAAQVILQSWLDRNRTLPTDHAAPD